MAPSIDCSKIHPSVDLIKVLHAVLGDNPAVIYFDKTKFETELSFFGKRIILVGVHPKSQAEKMNLALEETANKIASSVKTRSSDEYSLLINLYESFQKNIKYDDKELQANSRGLSNNPVSHNAYGALINRLAVCDGFSSAFALAAKKLGFECMLVIGRSTYTTSFAEHAWNIIKVRNKYYHLDVTWDARRYNEFAELSYAYFALTDEEISSDHTWNKAATPVCSYNDFSYYSKNGLYANNTEQLNKIIKAIAGKQANVFKIKLSRCIKLPNNAGDYLAQMVLNEVAKPGGRKRASYGWNEHTRCFFAKIV
ncbi:MAG: hypothetical protein FWC36_00775 [Spirochaetes bacterium]|nr:hypothetical protein [Spirochaetota bacterium]